MNSLLNDCEIIPVLGYYAAAQSKRTSDIVDMDGYEGVLFVALLGTLLENGTLDVFVEQHTLNQTSGMARVATTTLHTVTAAHALLAKSAIAVDIFQPRERYLQCNVTPAVANAVICGVIAIKYKGTKAPAVTTNLLKSTYLQSPAEA